MAATVKADIALFVVVDDPNAYSDADPQDRARKLQWASDNLRDLPEFKGTWEKVEIALAVVKGDDGEDVRALDRAYLRSKVTELLEEYQGRLLSRTDEQLAELGLDRETLKLELLEEQPFEVYYYSVSDERWCNERWQTCAAPDEDGARVPWKFAVTVDPDPTLGGEPVAIDVQVYVSIDHEALNLERS